MIRTQFRILAWAAKTFGPAAMDRQELAARLVEEAIEVAQVEGVALAVVGKVAERVYSRPPGELAQEIGGTMITLQAMAERAGLNLDECADAEWNRVCSIPVEHFRAKHAEKVRAGTAEINS